MTKLVFLILVVTIVGCAPASYTMKSTRVSIDAAVLPTTGTASTTNKPPDAPEQPTVISMNNSVASAVPSVAPTTGVVTPIREETPTAPVTSVPLPAATEEATQAPPNPGYEYVPLAEQNLEHYAVFVNWEPNSHDLIYALQKERGDGNVRRIGPGNWEWWRYAPESRQSSPLPPPESGVSMEARRALGICVPKPLEEDDCGREPIMWESPYGDRVVYNPISDGENTWMADKDGSNALQLIGVPGAQGTQWSSDGRWALVSTYAYRAPGMEVHYLVETDTGYVQPLESLTGHTITSGNFLRPQFSPDSRYLVYAATEDADYESLSGYGLYLMDLSTLESVRLSDLHGPFQWDADSQGLHVFDNAVADFAPVGNRLTPRKAALYHIDLSSRPFQETLLFDQIDFYPNESPSAWHWAYSPELQAIAYTGLRPENELGILFLSP